jgi:undecaprenyl-diphosphatase
LEPLLATISRLDAATFRAINTLFDSMAVDQLMLLLSSKDIWTAVIATVAGVLAILRKWQELRLVLIAVAVMGCCDALTSYGLKENIERLRPCYGLEGVRLIQAKCGSQFGFPSNHAANGMAIAASMHLLFRRSGLSLLLVGMAMLVSYSRIHLGVHYPLDVICGMFFGATVACAILLPLPRLKPDWVRY